MKLSMSYSLKHFFISVAISTQVDLASLTQWKKIFKQYRVIFCSVAGTGGAYEKYVPKNFIKFTGKPPVPESRFW